MLEVANGEHGKCVDILSKSAVDNKWRSTRVVEQFNNNNSIEAFEIEVDNKNYLNVSSSTRSSQKSPFMLVPTELYRLWVLIGRCHIQLFRDWVSV